jgi:SAM-dependent methyltransferase
MSVDASAAMSDQPQVPPAAPPAKVEYDPGRYWNERLSKDFSLAGAGHSGVGLSFNRWAYRVRRHVLIRTLRDAGIEPRGTRILELGFGTGFYLDLWRELGVGHVTGFDITEVAVEAARAHFGGAGWRFEAGDIGAPLPLDATRGTCDIATAFDVLFHLVEEKSWEGALDNLAAGLKPGGHALIFDKFQKKETAVSHVKRRTLARYEEALTARGFEILSVRPIFFFMNSPTDLSGFPKFAFKTAWSLARLPYKIGRPIGLGEVFGGAAGALLYLPEIALSKVFGGGPSTKALIARKRG